MSDDARFYYAAALMSAVLSLHFEGWLAALVGASAYYYLFRAYWKDGAR